MKYLTQYVPQGSGDTSAFESEMTAIIGEDANIPPVLVSGMKFYKCASVDTTAKTWSGYELVYNEAGYYELSDVITEDLTYSGMVPVISSIYSADAKLLIYAYYANPDLIPTHGLVLHVSLTGDKASAETGQTITKNGNPRYQVIDGIPCVYVNHYNNSLTINSNGVPTGNEPATWSLWVKEISNTGGESDGHLISLKNGQAIDGIDYVQGINFNITSTQNLGAGVYSGESTTWAIMEDSLSTDWHHIVMTRNTEGLHCFYCDGVLKAEKVIPEASYAINGGFLSLGYLAYYSGWGASGYVSNIRIYNRALTQDEIAVLANEFTPTSA